ncbi:MAG: type II toxin-antitoxin system Phd/YefM family antitoxin [Gloeobacterales cyanobacterium]
MRERKKTLKASALKGSGLAKRYHSWKLEDAKAKFSELVRQARTGGPQLVTVHGQEAVVVISVEEFAQISPAQESLSLHEFLSQSPLSDLDFEHEPLLSPVRDVEL